MPRYKLRTLLIVMAIGPPMVALVQEIRTAYRKSQCTTWAELQTPICVFGIPTPLRSKIVPRQDYQTNWGFSSAGPSEATESKSVGPPDL
jgi:hypothetical protein